MIPRYSRPKMAAIWSEETQLRTWIDIEILACKAWAKLGKIPDNALKEILAKADCTKEELEEKEKETKHDIAALVSVLQNRVGEAGRYIHMGLTSSDIVDTALHYRTARSCELILTELENLLDLIQNKAKEQQNIITMGRTHGIHAEPLTMGLKWLRWYDLIASAQKRISSAHKEIAVGKLSGAVGNYVHVPPAIEEFVCQSLGLKPDRISTQVIARDKLANYLLSLSLLGSAVETIALEIRHLQRTEVGEVREGFSKGQKGSSAMPHKRNPILSENLTGLARLLRSYAVPALENCALWHERDISHSSVERVILPDANIVADFMVARLYQLLNSLEVFPDQMQKNIQLLQGTVYSQEVLLRLIQKGASRDEAYLIVQENALLAIDQKTSFLEILKRDPRVETRLSSTELAQIFTEKPYLQHQDYIYKKVFSYNSNNNRDS